MNLRIAEADDIAGRASSIQVERGAKLLDRLLSRYRVARISADVVELDDLTRAGDAGAVRLALK